MNTIQIKLTYKFIIWYKEETSEYGSTYFNSVWIFFFTLWGTLFSNSNFSGATFHFFDVDHFFLFLPIPVVGYLKKNIIITNNLVHHFVKLLIHYL